MKTYLGAIFCFSAIGCSAELQGEGGAENKGAGGVGNDPGAVESLEVQELRTIEASEELTTGADCFELAGKATQLAVSPEGQAWVVLESEDGEVRLQVIDPMLESASEPIALELPAIVQANVWNAVEASFNTVEGLWRLEDQERVNVFPPDESAEISSFCGDLFKRGAVLAGGDFYEMRGDSWWQYSSPDDAPDLPTQIVRFDGACTDIDEAHWLRGDAGTIWRVGRDSVSAPIQIEGALHVAGTAGILGVLTDDQVWLASIDAGTQTWQPWQLPGGAALSWLDLAGGAAWLQAGSEFYRFDGETWSKGSQALGSASSFAAYATGVWTLEGQEACHYGMGKPIQLAGLRPFDQTREQIVEVEIQSAEAPTVELNGEPLEVSHEGEGHQVSVRLDEVGWSELSVSDGSLSRRLWVKRIPTEERSWESDILPIYETSCANAKCHGSSDDGGPPDLGSFESWLSYSHKIRSHVVENETMPPVASRGPEWSDAQREIVSEWLEGGLLP